MLIRKGEMGTESLCLPYGTAEMTPCLHEMHTENMTPQLRGAQKGIGSYILTLLRQILILTYFSSQQWVYFMLGKYFSCHLQ